MISAIVDGAIRDLAPITAASPTAQLSVEEGDELSVAVVVTDGGGSVTKWNIEEVEPLFASDSVEIAARAVASTGTTTGTLQGSGSSAQAVATYDVLAFAFGDSDKENILGATFGVPIGQPFTLNRAGLGAALDPVVKGQIIALVRDAESNTSELSTYGNLSGLAASFSGTFRAPPILTSPAAGSTEQSRTPTMSFTSATDGSLSLIVIKGSGNFLWEIFVPAGTNSVTLPALSVGGLAGSTTYEWHVEDFVVPGFNFNTFSLDFRDFSQSATESGPRTITTGP